MSKGLFFVVIVVALSLILCGCNKQSTNLELPENPIKFVTYSYCPEDSDHGYRAFDYNGRTYIHFAEHNGAFKKDIGSNCLGLIVQEGVEYDDAKRNQADFALWFTKSKFDEQELKWD